MTPTVAAAIARIARRRLTGSIVGLIIAVIVAVLSYRYIYNFIAGPFPATLADLAAVEQPGDLDRYFVTISGMNSYDTGYELETTRDGRVIGSVGYLILDLGERVLLVQTGQRPGQTAFTGYLTEPTDEVQSQIIAGIEASNPGLDGIFLPMQLTEDDFRNPGYLGIPLWLALTGLCLWGLFRAIQWRASPLSHPIARALGRFGDAQQTIAAIDAELQAPHARIGDTHLTPNWLVLDQPIRLQAARLDEIVWLYKLVTKRRVNGVPVGQSFTAEIRDRHGVALSIFGTEEQVNQLLNAAAQRAPWAIVGFSAELEQAWKKNRGALLASVEQRRAMVNGGA